MMTREYKAKWLREFCDRAGYDLADETFEMWVNLPDVAFLRKLAEWSGWRSVGGRLEF